MHRTKSYYHGFFKYGAISKSHLCEADVCRCQNLSNFMTSTENVNKLCLFGQEAEHLQVKLTMMVCPERIECLQLHRRRVHSDSAFRKHELAGRMLISCGISSCRPEPGKQSLLASTICFNFYWKLRFIWGLRIILKTVFQLNQLARFNTDIRLEDRQSQLGSNKSKER